MLPSCELRIAKLHVPGRALLPCQIKSVEMWLNIYDFKSVLVSSICDVVHKYMKRVS